MKHSLLIGTLCAVVFVLIAPQTNATSISGQGTWESTLQGRDLDGNTATFEAYYDTTLNITWLADANAGAGSVFDSAPDSGDGAMTGVDATAWVNSLNFNGVSGWRLTTVAPINGSTFILPIGPPTPNNGTADFGYTSTTTDGTDGGWRDSSGNPVSELGHMFYVTLGNLGLCTPNGGGSATGCIVQQGFGLSNSGPFSNIIPFNSYYTGTPTDPTNQTGDFGTFALDFSSGFQGSISQLSSSGFAWAVHSGDVGTVVSTVPLPAATWLFGSGLIGLIGLANRKREA